MDFQVTYVWNITNQNELSETETSEICSPIFTASPDEVAHRWNVCLRWYSGNPDYYGVYIYLKDEPFHTMILVDFKIEVIDNNDELIASHPYSVPHIFDKCKGWGRSNLINKRQYNIKNIKKIKVELKLTRPEDIDITDKIPKRETVPYEWEIQNQDELSETETSQIFSPIFSGSPDEIPHLWNISIKWDSKNPDFYGIYFHLKDEPFHTKIIMGYNYKVIDDKGKVIRSVPFTDSHIYEKNERRGFEYEIDRRKYNIKNIKKIKVELKLIRPKEINVINVRRAKVCENLLELYKSQEFSDITIFCENREFKVHKQILAARSPVFKKKISEKNKENIFNEIIKNVTAEAVDIFIKFLYSGSVEIPFEHLEDILILSVQYLIKDLQNKCIYEMEGNLSIETAIQILLIADKHELSAIKTKSLMFFKENKKVILDHKSYKNIPVENRNKALELLLSFI